MTMDDSMSLVCSTWGVSIRNPEKRNGENGEIYGVPQWKRREYVFCTYSSKVNHRD